MMVVRSVIALVTRVEIPAAPVDEAAAVVEPDARFKTINVEAKPRLYLRPGWPAR